MYMIVGNSKVCDVCGSDTDTSVAIPYKRQHGETLTHCIEVCRVCADKSGGYRSLAYMNHLEGEKWYDHNIRGKVDVR